MFGNKLWSTKVGARFLSDLVIFSIFSSDFPSDLHEPMRVATKISNVFLGGLNTK